MLPRAFGLALPLTISKVSLASDPLYLSQTDISGNTIAGLRKPKNDITTYSLTDSANDALLELAGRAAAQQSLGDVHVRDRRRSHGISGRQGAQLLVLIDYLVTDDTAHTFGLPSLVNGLLGSLPAAAQAGPVGALRSSAFRWNPTQFRLTSGIVQGSDRRASFIQPSGCRRRRAVAHNRLDAPLAKWRRLRAAPDERQLRRGGRCSPCAISGTTATARLVNRSRRGEQLPDRGFERERTMIASVGFAPLFSSWLRPRADIGTQYNMLRDPNARSFLSLPGVIGVDSVLAARDSASLLRQVLPRRMTSAQTASAASTIDVAALSHYAADSSLFRRLASHVAPMDISYHAKSSLGARRGERRRAARVPARPRRAVVVPFGERDDGDDRWPNGHDQRGGRDHAAIRRRARESLPPHDNEQLDRSTRLDAGDGPTASRRTSRTRGCGGRTGPSTACCRASRRAPASRTATPR